MAFKSRNGGSGGGGGTPGGSNGQLQYNNNGSFGGYGLGSSLAIIGGNLALNQGTFNVKDSAYGALGNGLSLTDITTSSTTTISSASYTFTSADVGKLISINAGATVLTTTGNTGQNDIITNLASTTGVKIGQSVFGSGIPAGAYVKEVINSTSVRMNLPAATSLTGTSVKFIGVLNTTISSVSGGSAVLAVACSSTISGNAWATFGTDDTAAIQSAINAANTAKGGTLILPAAMYIVSALTWYTNLSLLGFGWGIGGSILKHIKTTDMTAPVIQFSDTTGATYYYNCNFYDFEIDGLSATMATPGVSGKGISAPYGIRLNFERVYVHDTPATGIAYDAGVSATAGFCIVENCGRLKPPAGGGGIGNGVGEGVNSGGGIIAPYAEQRLSQCNNNIIINCYSHAIFYETQIVTPATTPSTQDTVQINNNMVYMGGLSLLGISDCGCTGAQMVGNTVYCEGAGAGQDAISSSVGTFANSAGVQGMIANNVVYNGNIAIDYSAAGADPQQFSGYQVLDNKIYGNGTVEASYIINTGATSLNTLSLKNNQGSGSSTSGLIIANSGGGGINDLILDGNTFCNNAVTIGTTARQCGISIGSPITRLTMTNNTCFDNTAGQKQLYGVIFNNIAITSAFIVGNNFAHNATGPINIVSGTTISGFASNNYPLGIRLVATGTSDTATVFDGTIEWTSTTASAKSETIPGATAANTAQIIKIKDGAGTAATYNITVTPASGTINGASSYAITTNGQSITIQSDGVSNWVIT